jgi:tetratricopeptide (TPR) repeat protein
VRIQHCRVEGLLGPIGYIDLVDLDEQRAREKLLAGIKRERAKPTSVPFPTAPAPSGPLVKRPTFPGSLPPVWNVPYPHNPLFTGREELLTQLATTLHAGQPTALSQPQAISGLGGIGKTQLALEYAYRYRGDYQAVLWAQADTRENLTSSYLTIVALLNLPEKSEQESARAIAAVKNWFQRNTGWLLILDNADELALARDFLPPSMGGQVLLTTRAQATGRFARRLEVDTLPTEQGTLFLLRRAGLLAPDATLEQAPEGDRDIACAICEELGGLPLALDQAGAYIEETGCRLSEYQQLYQRRRADLLAERRGQLVDDHPLPVATTWSLSFQKVEQKNPAAADLLRLCVFLAPDAIPEAIITEGAEHLGPQLAAVGADPYLLNQAIEALRAYSLLRREVSGGTAPLLSVHRLVQAVLKDQMDEQNRQLWAERAIRAVNTAFPEVEHQTWPQCDRLLAHALICTEWMKQERMTFPEAARLLNEIGWYLRERGRYREAEPLLREALRISELEQGEQHQQTARAAATLGWLYSAQGRYIEAEPLYLRALEIYEQELGETHPDTATSLNSLASLYYHAQGKYAQAEPLYLRALEIYEQELGETHPDTATSLNSLAELYHAQGKYAQAELLFQRALAICEQQLGAQHPDTASSLNNLALLYHHQGKYKQAEPLYQRALSICKQQLGVQHPDTARSLNNLAALYRAQGKYSQAEPLFKRALAICEQQLGPQHPDTASSLNNLAALYWNQGKYSQAEPLYQQALAIREQQLGPRHPDTALSVWWLAALSEQQQQYEKAASLYQRALAIDERTLGPQHPTTQRIRANYARLLRTMGHDAEATALDQP